MGSLGARTHSTHSHTQLTLSCFSVTAIGCSLFPLGLVVLVSLTSKYRGGDEVRKICQILSVLLEWVGSHILGCCEVSVLADVMVLRNASCL